MKHLFRTLPAILILFVGACGAPAPVGNPTPRKPPPPPPAKTATASAAPPTSTSFATGESPEATSVPPTATAAPAPTSTPSIVTFAAIGDYGLAGVDESEVADLVKSWNPAFIITLGDNNYPDGKAETIDRNIGQYYSEFIYPYKGEYGPGSAENRFFPSLGNHDWHTPDLKPYLDYFELPGNERYYDFVWGPVHLFALDADSREPDGVGASSVQAQWLRENLAASTSPWQIVYMHQPPYSSGHHGSTDWMQWPFAEWGADAVLAGHDHSYERLIIDGIPYIVNGLGGHPSRYFYFRELEGSQFQYRSGHGALRITADSATLTFEMITVAGEVIDSQVLTRTASVAPGTVTELPDPSGFEWQVVATGYTKPLLVTHAGDGTGRIFVVEQTGAIKILGQDAAFLNLSGQLTSQGFEQGLLGLAFDPDFETNGYFYVNYTDINGDTVISRFNVDPNDPGRADPGSESIILRLDQPYPNHNGGHLVFGPDGLLYAGMGDGGAAGDPLGNAQNPGTFLGKMLRIRTEDNTIEIYASGLRNPWRYDFDPVTGEMYISDVGQNQWEEVNVLPAGQPAGANFGWDYFEGTHTFEGNPPANVEFVSPVYEYNHSEGCSITGGVVYRGRELPEFYGVYFFSDFCFGTVWGLVRATDGSWLSAELFDPDVTVTSFGTDETGEIYLVSQEGTLFKLVHR